MRKNSIIVALVATALVVSASTNAFALRQLTEAERAQVIAEYLAEKEAKAAAKPAEAAPAESKEAAPAAVVKVEVVQAEAKNDAPAVVVKTEEKAEAKVEAEKVETKAEVASADVTIALDTSSKPDPLMAEKELWATGPRPAGVNLPIEILSDVPTVKIPATLEVKGSVEEVKVGDKVFMIYPDRGATVSAEKLAAKSVVVPDWKGGKLVFKELPTFTAWPKDRPYDFSNYTSLRDFLSMRPYGLVVTMCGVGNYEEAIRGRPGDSPVATMAVLENPVLDENGRVHGTRKLYAVGKRTPISVQEYQDYDGVVYWCQLRVPASVVATKNRQVHWRSAKYRVEGTIANDSVAGGEPQCFLTIFFGGREGSERKVNGKIVGAEGRESTIPVHPLVNVARDDVIRAVENYKATHDSK